MIGSKQSIRPYWMKKKPHDKDDSEPPIHPVWLGKEPQGTGVVTTPPPVTTPVSKAPHDKDGSKPSFDQYDMEKELLDLLQRKFADDNSMVRKDFN